MENNFDFDKFKPLFTEFIKKHYNVCSNFYKELDNCREESDFLRLIYTHRFEIVERLEVSINDYSEYIDLDNECLSLYAKITELNDRLDASLEFDGTLDSTFKIQAVKEHLSKYTTWELEELLANGKEYLKQKWKLENHIQQE